MKTPPHKPSANSAFTLVELLIVIVIIAVLAAVAVPIFNAVKDKANSTKSGANLRSIGAALAAYQNDHDGKMPAIEGSSEIPQLTNWVSELVIALNDDTTADELALAPPVKIFVSPSIAWPTSGGSGVFEYGDLLYTYSATECMIGLNYDDQPDPEIGRNPSRIDKRPESILIVEGAQDGTNPHSHPAIAWGQASGDLSSGETGTFVEFRYRGRLNALMSDYSVVTFGKKDAAEIGEHHWKGYDYPDGY